MKKALLFGLIFLAFVIISVNFLPKVYACEVEYLCNNWGSCNNGIQTRICEDTRCGTGEIIERRLCAASGNECSTKYQCNDWSVCNYFDKAQDILSNKLRFSGYQERICSDVNSCGKAFAEERKCTDSFNVNFLNVERCGISFVVALDINSKREVSTISADAWKQQKLDIAFVQSNFSYCPTCYNGFKDGDEEEIDCGGSCKICSDEIGERNQIILVSSSWLISLLLFLALIFVSFFDKKTKLKYNLYQAHNAIDSGNKEKLLKHVSAVRKHYKNMNAEQKDKFTKDVERLYRRI